LAQMLSICCQYVAYMLPNMTLSCSNCQIATYCQIASGNIWQFGNISKDRNVCIGRIE